MELYRILNKYKTKKHELIIKNYNDYERKNEEQKYDPSKYYTFQAWNILIEVRVTNKGLYYVYTQNFFLREKPKTDKPIQKNLIKTDDFRTFERYGYFYSFSKAVNLYYYAINELMQRIYTVIKEVKNELFTTV